MKKILIAGTHSGVGKTTISMGIMAALRKRSLNVAPFKCGPDYIDPGFHKYVTGNPSYNLDSYLLPEDKLLYLFHKGMESKDIGIIEGVMGLYDGFGTKLGIGSSAHISQITDTPIILVIDGSGTSNSAAAIVHGYKSYGNANIQGVIINRVSGEKHYELLKDIIEKNTGIKCIGYMIKNSDVSLESRHLGLIPVDELKAFDKKINNLVELIEKYIDLDALLDISNMNLHKNSFCKDANFIDKYKSYYKNKKIGIALDKAFSFYYQGNMDVLEDAGAKLVPFSPLEDNRIPDDLDSIYLGGGFPEMFAKDLSDNTSFINSLYDYLENGGKCFAECGGLMYLSQGINTLANETFSMVGFLPFICKMTKKLQRFGYVEVQVDIEYNQYHIRAHEFHHSEIDSLGNELDYAYGVSKFRDDILTGKWQCGITKKNTLAGYPHLYFLSNLELMTKII